jgi:O-antigen/teichoic acid export membrane protein
MDRIASGASWMIVFRLVERSFGVISTLILARLLVPDDFGLVAMAMSVIALIEVASAFGFDMVLIQANRAERVHYDTAFTFNAMFGFGCAVVMLLLARPTAVFYNDPRLFAVMCALSSAWAIQGLENVGIVDFRRQMTFHKEFAFLFCKRIASFTVTMIAAYLLRSYWALVIGTIAGRAAGVLLSYFMHPFRPRLSLAARRDLMSFSGWLLFNNILNFAISRVSNFVIGKTINAHALGLYTVAYEIGCLPTSEIVAPINRAVYPVYARIAHDRDQLRAGFLNVISAIALFAVPAAFGIAAIAEPLVVVCLSAKWMEAVPLLKVLGFLGAVAAIGTNTYPAFLALGLPRTPTLISAVRVAIAVPGMIIAGLNFGVIGVAWFEFINAALILPLSWWRLFPLLNIALGQFFALIYRPFFAAVPMYFVVRAFLDRVTAGQSASSGIGVLLSAVALGAVVYVAIVVGLWLSVGGRRGVEGQLVKFALGKLGRSGASPA